MTVPAAGAATEVVPGNRDAVRRLHAPGAAYPHEMQGDFAIHEGVLESHVPFNLFHGGWLPTARIAWRLAGAASAPVIAALGGISAHRTVFSHESREGWWDPLAGDGKPLDTRRCRVLGIDFLGGSGGSTGPALDETFPSISSCDQAEALRLVLDHLGIATLQAIAGASYGGMVALAFATRFPTRLQRLLVISAAHRTHPMATAWRCVQREIVRRALEQGNGAAGLELARALAMATYRSADEFALRFSANAARGPDGTFEFPVAQYLLARGAAYSARYSPSAFLCLSESIDLHSIDPAAVRTPTTLVGVRQDQLVPLADLRELAAELGALARLVEVDSLYGHDAFLKEPAQLAPVFESALFSPLPTPPAAAPVLELENPRA
jgi:homoserine O-acetyltransferase